MKKTAPHGVSFMYRKAFGGAPWFAGGPITDSMANRPAANLVHYEYASWSTDPNYHIWGKYPDGDLNNLALNVVFMDSHAKKIRGKQFRHLRYDNLGWRDGNKIGMDLDWFLTQDNNTSCAHCNASTPADDTSDID